MTVKSSFRCVARKQVQALDIVSLTWWPWMAVLPPFTPGAHVDMHLPGGLVRQYSLCNDPEGATCYRIGVLRTAPRAVARRPCMRWPKGRC